MEIPAGYEPGALVVSHYGICHRVSRYEVDSSGVAWLTLVDGREFAAQAFQPFVGPPAGGLAICEQCEATDA